MMTWSRESDGRTGWVLEAESERGSERASELELRTMWSFPSRSLPPTTLARSLARRISITHRC